MLNIISLQGNADLNPSKRFCFIHVRMDMKTPTAGRNLEPLELSSLVHSLFGKLYDIFMKLNINVLHESSILLLEIYSRDMKT